MDESGRFVPLLMITTYGPLGTLPCRQQEIWQGGFPEGEIWMVLSTTNDVEIVTQGQGVEAGG